MIKIIFITIGNLLSFFPKLIFKIYIKRKNTEEIAINAPAQENSIQKNQKQIGFEPILVRHGSINANGYLFNKIAYISDCSSISKIYLKKLMNVKLLIIDCLKFKTHSTHLNYEECINYINKINPKKAILTNLHSDMDYSKLKKKLKYKYPNIIPAYDNFKITI